MSIEDMVIGILAEDHDIIPYRKSLRKIAGSVTATILLQQMIWRGKQHGWEPFYKFRAPCSHELYKPGDSWIEEMGFSVEEFDAAIKRIGTKITGGTSKAEALSGTTPASLVLYWTDADRMTWYHVNHDLLGKLLLPIYLVDGESPNTLKVAKPNLPIVSENTTENREREAKKQPEQNQKTLSLIPSSEPIPVNGSSGHTEQRTISGLDTRRLVDGHIPDGTGQNAVEVFYERHSALDKDTRLSAPIEKDIIEKVLDLSRWRTIVIAWHQCGLRPKNITGQLDWYRDGIPESYRHKVPKSITKTVFDVPDYIKRIQAGESPPC